MDDNDLAQSYQETSSQKQMSWLIILFQIPGYLLILPWLVMAFFGLISIGGFQGFKSTQELIDFLIWAVPFFSYPVIVIITSLRSFFHLKANNFKKAFCLAIVPPIMVIIFWILAGL